MSVGYHDSLRVHLTEDFVAMAAVSETTLSVAQNGHVRAAPVWNFLQRFKP